MAEESELMRGSLQLLPPDTVNPFNLPEVERQACQVWRYRNSHSTLVIQVTLDNLYEKSKYIWFDSVVYFSGPMGWFGADFRLMSRDDVIKIMRQLDGFSNPQHAEFLPLDIGGIELQTQVGVLIRILAGGFSVWDSFNHSSF